MPTIITPNMGLILPVVGQEPGPTWASDQNASGVIIDQHNHTSGQGVQIPTAGLNINTDLPFNSNNATLLNSVRWNNLASPLSGSAPNLTCGYVAAGELYYNDASGNQVQITKAGSVNATSSGISSGTATASFVGGVLVVDSNTNTPANIQGGSILLGNIVANSNYATVNPPSALGANYSLTVPPSNTTGSTVFMTYDTSNNMGLGPNVTGGLTSSNLAANTIGFSSLFQRTVVASTGTVGQLVKTGSLSGATSSTGFVGIASITLTTSGNPVMLRLGGTPTSGTPSNVYLTTNGSPSIGYINFVNTTTSASIEFHEFATDGTVADLVLPPSGFSAIDYTVVGSPGTYTYEVEYACNGSPVVVGVTNVTFLIWEMV
jgi:hypothetical protein